MKAVKAQDFITLAEELIQEINSPIKIRAATSRAYYGAYHAAKSFHESLASQGTVATPVKGGVHEQLIQCLINPTVSYTDQTYLTSKSLGYMLARVRKCRNSADYTINSDVPLEDAQTTVAEAKLIVSKSESLKKF